MTRHRVMEWLLLVAILAACYVVAAYVLWPQLARAHEWYPSDCCSSTDCYEISPSDLEPIADGYWRVKRTGEIFSQEDTYRRGNEDRPRVRRTPPEAGGTWHRCSRKQGDPDAPTICLFIPPLGG